MISSEFVLVSSSKTILSVDAATAGLCHAPLIASDLAFRLSHPSGTSLGERAVFELFGRPALLERVDGERWSLKQGAMYASPAADGSVRWEGPQLQDTDLFYVLSVETALILSPRTVLHTKPPASDARKRLLMIAPWLSVGGADKVNLDLVTGLSADFAITLVTTVGSGPWTSRFEPYVQRLIHLAQILPPDLHTEALVRIIQRLAIDTVILSNTREGYQAIETLRGLFPALPIFDLLHGQGGDREGGGYPAISKPYERGLTRRIVINDYLAGLMTNVHGVIRERIVRIFNGVDVDHFDPTLVTVPTNSSLPIVAFIGRLSYEKHPEHVLAIARELPTSVACQFVLAGHGHMMPALQRDIAEAPPPHPVLMIGHVEDIRGLLAQTCVLILTSEMEGLPIVVLEAMAMGVPIVSSAVGGVPELIRDGKEGFLIPYGPCFASEAADALVQLLENEPLRRDMGKRARERAVDTFSMTAMISHYRDVLSASHDDLSSHSETSWSGNQNERLKNLEVEIARLWKAVSDLKLDSLILKEAAFDGVSAPPVAMIATSGL